MTRCVVVKLLGNDKVVSKMGHLLPATLTLALILLISKEAQGDRSDLPVRVRREYTADGKWIVDTAEDADSTEDKKVWDGTWFPRAPDKWNGTWFPHTPGVADRHAVAELNPSKSDDLHDSKHGIKMGIKNPKCDDGEVNLGVDWDMNPSDHICFENKALFLPDAGVRPLYTREYIPATYNAPHKCMKVVIEYDRVLPSFGTHRPLWPQYGEYTYVPKQRWLHNLEHGAIVMLYHPCANKNEVNLIKKLVKSCLYRHVISPYNLLSPERPLALLAWGHVLEISKVDPSLVVGFIKNHALRGPEKTSKDGQYTFMLKEHARVVSDIDDSNLCPFTEPVSERR